MADPQPSDLEKITCTYQPDVAGVETWLRKMIDERRFVELIVAVLALLTRLRDLNTNLMRHVAHLTRKRPSSEKLRRLENQTTFDFIDQVTAGSGKDEPKGKRKRKPRRGKHPGRRPLPEHLPRIEDPNPVPKALRTCPKCGVPMTLLGHTRCEALDVVPASLIVRVRIDESLRCPTDGTIVSAPPPARIVPRGKLGDTLIVEALADKYLLNVPIERQCSHWARQGVDIPAHTLGRSVSVAIDLLEPIAAGITERMRASDILSMDATSIRLLDPDAPEGRRFGTIWCGIGDGEWVGFTYWANASAEGAEAMVGTSKLTGRIIQCDGTPTTNFIERGGGKRPGCWSHARRRFVEAARSGDAWALDGLRLIAKLFIVEKIASRLDEPPSKRRARRQEHSTQALDDLRAWVDHHRGIITPKSPLGKALGYLHRQWDRLVHFLQDGRIELTNNHVERALRPLVQGLKSWLFAYDDIGAKRTTIILTVVGTCVAKRINPRAYLHKVLALLVQSADVSELLPDELAERFPELRMPTRASPDPDDASLKEIIAGLEAKLAAPACRHAAPAV